MEFIKYPSIDNVREKVIESIKNNYADCCNWVVTEKIHGANIAFYINKQHEIKVASRNRFLEEKDLYTFYNVKTVLNKYRSNLNNLVDKVKCEEYIIVYGELYGGYYNGKQEEGCVRVQKEVEYTSYNDFIAFDISLIGKNKEFCDYNLFSSLCKENNIPYIEPLYIGKFDEALKISKEYRGAQTYIPKRHGLKPIRGNIREGNVIKPCSSNLFFKSGSRVILKDKNENFKENVYNPKHQSDLILQLQAFVTRNRLNAVVSKFGQEIYKDLRKLMIEIKKDILEELKTIERFDIYSKKFKKEFKRIDRSIWKLINDDRSVCMY